MTEAQQPVQTPARQEFNENRMSAKKEIISKYQSMHSKPMFHSMPKNNFL